MADAEAPAPLPESTPAPAAAGVEPVAIPRTTLWKKIKRASAAIWLLSSAAVCVFVAGFAPTAGGPVDSYVPSDVLALVRLRNGDAIWRAMEAHPGMRGVWNDPELQRLTGWQEKLDDLRARWAKKPALLRDFVSPTRRGLRFLTGSEIVACVSAPPRDASGERGKAPVLFLVRVQGGRGALTRLGAYLLMRLGNPQPHEPHFYDLGGGLLAAGFQGARPGSGEAVPTRAAPLEPDAVAEVQVRPRAVAVEGELNLAHALLGPPSWPEIFGLERLPDLIQLRLRVESDESGDTLRAEGFWLGALPARGAGAPFLSDGLPPGTPPLLEARIPLDLGKLFRRNLFEAYRNDKDRRRWESRLVYLSEAGIDLNEQLWPAFGKTLRVRIVEPPPGAAVVQPRALASIPFAATTEARMALGELSRVRWRGLFDGTAPEEADRPYVLRLRHGDAERYVLVKGNYTRMTWVATSQAVGWISDAGPFAMLPMPAAWAPNDSTPDAPYFEFRTDGQRMAPMAAVFAQLWLEELRDEIGPAEFLERYPDEGAAVELVRRAASLWGSVSLHLVPVEENAETGRISGEIRIIRNPQP
ncbi:MAG: hypothetical protein HS116_16730 [Planctomycetes bacterium]|nr:hypothetical protein [Planctomycetota bacterium]